MFSLVTKNKNVLLLLLYTPSILLQFPHALEIFLSLLIKPRTFKNKSVTESDSKIARKQLYRCLTTLHLTHHMVLMYTDASCCATWGFRHHVKAEGLLLCSLSFYVFFFLGPICTDLMLCLY